MENSGPLPVLKMTLLRPGVLCTQLQNYCQHPLRRTLVRFVRLSAGPFPGLNALDVFFAGEIVGVIL
jgi:hypothetical protein